MANLTHRAHTFARVSLLSAVAVLVAFAAAGVASAVDVQGALQVPENLAAPEAENGPKSFYWKVWNGVIDPRARTVDSARDLTVVLTGNASAAPRGCDDHRISGGDFAPSAIVVRPGTDLALKNEDGCSHELYSDNLEGFAAIQTAPGNARTIRLPGSGGPFEIRDRVYPQTRGWVHVLPDLVACGTITSRGRYSFEGVSAGTYTLKVFYQGHEVASREVEIPDEREHTIESLPLNTPSR